MDGEIPRDASPHASVALSGNLGDRKQKWEQREFPERKDRWKMSLLTPGRLGWMTFRGLFQPKLFHESMTL